MPGVLEAHSMSTEGCRFVQGGRYAALVRGPANMSMHLTRDLETLHRHIMSMCAMVEEIVHRAVDDLGKPDVELSRQLVESDDEVDRWDVRIEEECLKILALHSPVANDLRRVTSVLKIAWELERVADHRTLLALLPIPQQIRRFVALPGKSGQARFIALEELLLLHLHALIQHPLTMNLHWTNYHLMLHFCYNRLLVQQTQQYNLRYNLLSLIHI